MRFISKSQEASNKQKKGIHIILSSGKPTAKDIKKKKRLMNQNKKTIFSSSKLK